MSSRSEGFMQSNTLVRIKCSVDDEDAARRRGLVRVDQATVTRPRWSTVKRRAPGVLLEYRRHTRPAPGANRRSPPDPASPGLGRFMSSHTTFIRPFVSTEI